MRLLSTVTIFISSLLLFLIQPIIGKAILPHFGGSAGVWTASIFFFQAALLLGYWYAHLLIERLPAAVQRGLHITLLAGGILVLPVRLSLQRMPADISPIWQILGLLAASIGLPYLSLAATSPLVQAWSWACKKQPFPYKLFAVSNAASLAALLAYPFVIEPQFTLTAQLRVWSLGYTVFAVLMAFLTWHAQPMAATEAKAPGPLVSDRLLWIALAAVPSALWLAAANQLGESIAPVPLLWIIPLSTYLLTLILVFHRNEWWYRPAWLRWLLPLGVAAIAAAAKENAWSGRAAPGILLFTAGLFICCLFCHGALAERKPAPHHLTSFYLLVALGGALGAALVSLIAPLIFNSYLELPIVILGCLLLAASLLYGSARRQLVRLGILGAAALGISVLMGSGNVRRLRNFYGVLELRVEGHGENMSRALYNGTILHGLQFLAPGRHREAITYYSPESGIGRELTALELPLRRIGIIGLGVGAIAAYANPGDVFRFYEINPLVIDVANEQFSFLRECRGAMQIVPGDARLALERETPQRYDMLVVDAFSGDSVPLHLLTREAFQLYLRHLAPGGAIVINITSKYTNLAPVIYRIATSLGKDAAATTNAPGPARRVMASTWITVRGERPSETDPTVWHDDYNRPIEILKF